MATKDVSDQPSLLEDVDLDELNRRIAAEGAAATTADKMNPPATKPA